VEARTAQGATRRVDDRPGLDVLGAASRLAQGRVVQVVTLAAPLERDATLSVHNQAGPTEAWAVALSYAPAQRDTRILGHAAAPGHPPRAINVTVTEEGGRVTFAFPAAELPPWATCLEPAALAATIEGDTTFSDLLQHDHDRAHCAPPKAAPVPALGALGAMAALALAALAGASRRR
jgi:hypothetical protein